MTKKKRLRKLRRQADLLQTGNARAPVQITLTDEGMLIESGHGFRFLNLGGIDLARPRIFNEAANRQKAEANLRAKYGTGRYDDAETIGEILNYQCAYFENILDKILGQLASRDCLHFLLDQYDKSRKIEDKFRAGKLSDSDAEKWKQDCTYTRRAYKFLCERIVVLRPLIQKDAIAPLKDLPNLFDEMVICAEQLVAFSMHSDQTRYIFRDKSVFSIFPEGKHIYWDLSLNDPLLTHSMTEDIHARVSRDAKIRDTLFVGKAFDQDWEKHETIIGEAFEKMSGMRYEKAIRALSIIPKMSRPGDMGICMIPKDKLIEGAAINMETTPEAIEKVFSGFWLSAENMSTESRNFWNPKNVYRAYRRALFEIGGDSEKHLTWSESMFTECWFMLLISMAYGTLPPEWSHPELQTAIGRLQNECGKWFEHVVRDQMLSLGQQAICSREGFGQQSQRLDCPHGEIDLIAYNSKERLLIVGESKMTMIGAEPRFFRDELDDFVRKKKCYANKFRKKIEWIVQNLPAFSVALKSSNEFTGPIEPVAVAPVMVTFLPSIARYFIPDFPCVSLSELVADFTKAGRWPYSKYTEHPS